MVQFPMSHSQAILNLISDIEYTIRKNLSYWIRIGTFDEILTACHIVTDFN
jgi:hypothetical protein